MMYGIDFGNHDSRAVALASRGDAVIVQNRIDAKNEFPACVFFDQDGTIFTGDDAKKRGRLSPQRFVCCMKRGLSADENSVYDIDGAICTQEEAVVQILAVIRAAIEEFNGDTHPKAALTVPVVWTYTEKECLRNAARKAGFSDVYLVSEPVAALLADGYNKNPTEETVLIFDLGGATLKLAAARLTVGRSKDGVPEQNGRIITVRGDETLGGMDWNYLLYDYILEQIECEWGIDRDEIADQISPKLWDKTEHVMRSLSYRESMNLRFTVDDQRITVRITKADFLEITEHLVNKALGYVDDLLAGLEGQQIDRVCMLGGGSRIPGVREALERRFPGKVQLKEEHLLAKGAAIAAAAAERSKELN